MQLLNRIVPLSVFLLAAASLRADINSSVLPPPTADPTTARVLRGSQVTVELRGHYGGSSFVRFWVVRPPAHGNLSQLHTLGDNRATILYSNNGDPDVTADTFTYIIQAGGRVSAPAEVRIALDEPAARLRAPERIDFAEIMAGKSEVRSFTIANDGGGVLEGHLSVSSPWALAVPDYRVQAGQTETIPIAFQPNEVRTFVGQVTITGSDGRETVVPVSGAATAPLKIAPDPLRLAPPENPGEARRAIVFLTNRMNEPLTLNFQVGSSFEAIEPIVLRAKSDQDVTVAVRPSVTGAVHESIVIAGPGFTMPLRVDADAPAPKPTPTMAPTRPPAPAPVVVRPEPTATIAPIASLPKAPPPIPQTAAAPVESEGTPLINVTARRLGSTRWELQWPPPKRVVASYRIEERNLALDGSDELQITWRPITGAKIVTTDERVTAEVGGMKPHELHMLRVTALKTDGSALWESNVVPLSPLPKASHGRAYLLILFGGVLIVVLFLRWRAKRPFA